jgi:hypothetical protein
MNNPSSYSKRDNPIDMREQQIKFVNRFTKNGINDDENLGYKPDKKLSKFYQVCKFKNIDTNMYDVRVVIFNEYAEIIKVKEYLYDNYQCHRLIKSKKHNQVKTYSTNNIDLVGMPEMDDLLKMQSSLL